jgi:hypothetical protein
MNKAAHTVEVIDVYERIVQASPLEAKHITVGDGSNIHLLEGGEGSPLFY